MNTNILLVSSLMIFSAFQNAQAFSFRQPDVKPVDGGYGDIVVTGHRNRGSDTFSEFNRNANAAGPAERIAGSEQNQGLESQGEDIVVTAQRPAVDKKASSLVKEFLSTPDDSFDSFYSGYLQLEGGLYELQEECNCSVKIPRNLIPKVEAKVENSNLLSDPQNFRPSASENVGTDPVGFLTTHHPQYQFGDSNP